MGRMDSVSKGWISGAAGVLIFGGSLPATRLAVVDFDPVFLTVARATIAGAIGMVPLLLLRQRLPARGDLLPLALVAAGVVVGFPLLTALALRHMAASSSIVFTGLLPLVTAVFAVLRGGERPRRCFWLFAVLGALCVAGFAWSPASLSAPADNMLMLAAIVVCGLGYAEGAVLARRLGGWQVICWALVLAWPAMLLGLCLAARPVLATVGAPAWIGLGYVSLFSMLIGFMFWYRGLALGGTAAVGQLQLAQPLVGLGLAALVLREPISPLMILVLMAVIGCVVGARHFSTRKVPS